MKNYYKISEISKLYGIGTDSLRYYERLGILKPRRDVNGYRLYSLQDMYKLNLIRDLRLLDFSMAQIKEYLDDQNIGNTLDMLERELGYLASQIRELQRRQEELGRRVRQLKEHRDRPTQELRLVTMARKPCVRLSQHITRDEEMDFVIQKLQRRHEDALRDFGSLSIGAFFSPQELQRGLTNVYESVFFLLDEDGEEEADFSLPAGTYLSTLYRGSYEQSGPLVRRLREAVSRLGLTPLGQPFEIYLIDNRHTIRPQEFLTEVRLRVELPPDISTEDRIFTENLW